MNIIPLINVQDQQFSIVLDNQNCTVRVYQLNDWLYLDLYLNEDAIILGTRCVRSAFVLQYTNQFKGNFIWITDNNQEPNYIMFSESNFLAYITQDELNNKQLN